MTDDTMDSEGFIQLLLEAQDDEDFTYDGRGNILLTEDGEPATGKDFEPGEWYGNLADGMETFDLKAIANELTSGIEEDDRSRQKWLKRYEDGLEELGFDRDADNGSTSLQEVFVRFPLFAEACVQFAARAYGELLPSSGPVKTTIIGESNDPLVEIANRVKDHMNYQLQFEMDEFYEDRDNMLMQLPGTGSMFDKTYWDDLGEKPDVDMIYPEDFIVNYNARSLLRAHRMTHRMLMPDQDVLWRKEDGYFLPVETPPGIDFSRRPKTKDKADQIEGRQFDTQDDSVHELFEVHTYMRIPGIEKSEIPAPYIITVHGMSNMVLSVRRNWYKGDEKRKRREWFTHHKFLPWRGFYGIGLYHMIGNLSKTATATMRMIMTSGIYNSMPSALKLQATKAEGQNISVKPGDIANVASAGDDIRKVIMGLPFNEPSPVLFSLLGMVVDSGRRFAQTTDITVGDAANTGPVGTTVALIEQGSKVYSAIHKRLHGSFGRMFRLIADLNYENLDDRVTYKAFGRRNFIMRRDYDPGSVDVIPVSDPNIFSQTQRIAQAQTIVQLTQANPEVYGGLKALKRAHRTLLGAMNIPNHENLVPEEPEVPRRDPVAEIECILKNIPVKVYPDQDDDAHIEVFKNFLSLPGSQANPLIKQMLPAFLAHITEHEVSKFRKGIMIMMGRSSQMLGPSAIYTDKEEMEQAALSPGAEALVSEMAAAASRKLLAFPAPPSLPAPTQGGQPQQPEGAPAGGGQGDMISGMAKMADVQRKAENDKFDNALNARMEFANLQLRAGQMASQAEVNKAQADKLRSEAFNDAMDSITKMAQVRSGLIPNQAIDALRRKP